MYIHQREDWPRFHWNQDGLANQLASVRHRQGRIIGRMESLGFRLREEAVLNTLTQDVLKSSEIEGEFLDIDQVRSSLARRLGVDIGALTPADRHVDGVVDMMLDATQKYQDSLTDERLFGWHAALFPTGRSGMQRIRVGQWRDDSSGPMQVVSGPIGRKRVHYQAPPAERLPAEMSTFLDWFNSPDSIDPVLKAARRISGSSPSTRSTTATDAWLGRLRTFSSHALSRARNVSTARRPRSGSNGTTTTKFWSGPRRVHWTSAHGCSGFWVALTAPLTARKPRYRWCFGKPASGKITPASRSTTGSGRSLTAYLMGSRASSFVEMGKTGQVLTGHGPQGHQRPDRPPHSEQGRGRWPEHELLAHRTGRQDLTMVMIASPTKASGDAFWRRGWGFGLLDREFDRHWRSSQARSSAITVLGVAELRFNHRGPLASATWFQGA